MANKRRREVGNGAPETPQIPTESLPGSETLDPQNDGSTAGYEQFREQRIKENLARMQKLGIVDLSLKIKSSIAAKRAPRNLSSDRKTPTRDPSLLATEPRRRSSRLQNVTAVSYVEPKPEGKLKKDWILLDEGSKPEFYTEEQEKLLGSTELEWTLFVDGVGADGKRIYDPIKGKTCHQCRQKTLGHRTHCCKCKMVQGQFCGDCLYMRYGEHVLEANKNPEWVCPPCRGICNCSLCRQAKGWAPTGPMYKKIARLEYKSVAHFLIQTRRAPPATTEPEEDVGKTPRSAKRSLAFTDVEVPEDGKGLCKKAISGQKLDYGEKENGESKGENGDQDDCQTNVISFNEYEKSDIFGESKDEQDDMLDVGDNETGENKEEEEKGEQDDCKENVQPDMEIEDETGLKEESVDASKTTDEASGNEVITGNTPSATKKRQAKKRLSAPQDPLQDSIARRLRSRVNIA